LSRVAKRYAKALFSLANDEKLLDVVESDFGQIDILLQQSADFSSLLSNPLISDKEKVLLVKEIFAGKTDKLTFNFLNLLAEKKRMAIISDVLKEFKALMLEYTNKVEGELISAVKLSEAQVAEIRRKINGITGKTVLLKEKVDASILGGFVVKVEDWILDNSIRYQLSKLRERLIAG